MKTLLCFILLMVSLNCKGQSKLGSEWITGGGGQRIKFNQTGITTNNNTFILSYFSKGNSNICDTNGNLMLCSDGYTIYDKLGAVLDEGDTLVDSNFFIEEDGWSLYSQSSIFLPIDSDRYYFITPTFTYSKYYDCKFNGGSCFFDLLLYNVIDMKANGGAGKVVKRMQPLLQNAELSKTQMMACRHSNGKDWWLLKQGGDSNIVYKFLFTQDSVYDYGRQAFNVPIWGKWDIKGQTAISQDGDKYASTCQSDGLLGEIFLADFDRCYGKLSNPKVIQMPVGYLHDPIDSTLIDRNPVGLCFSPNGSYLYAMSLRNIYQYDLQDNTWYFVAGLDTTYLQFQDYSNAYLGSDDKLYIGNFAGLSKQMSVINNPDVKGGGCNFCPRCLRLDTLGTPAWVATPPCMPNYSLGAKVCFPDGVNNVSDKINELLVYPNPTSSIFYIKNRRGKNKELYNAVGQLIISTYKDEVEVSGFATGFYFIKCEGLSKKVIIE